MLQSVNMSNMMLLQPSLQLRPLCFMVLSKVNPFKLSIELKSVKAPRWSVFTWLVYALKTLLFNFYVNTDQNAAFTACSSIQGSNGLTLLSTHDLHAKCIRSLKTHSSQYVLYFSHMLFLQN